MPKILPSLKALFDLSPISSGAVVSFHHHLRNGDHLLNRAASEMAEAGLTDLTLAPSSLFPVHAPLIKFLEAGTVTGLRTNYMNGPVAEAISNGILAEPVLLQTHGGRARAITDGEITIDLALIAAPCCDRQGNATGALGPSACGPLGYGMVDAAHATITVLVTDHLVDELPTTAEITGDQIDYIVLVPRLGDPAGISSGTTKVTTDPISLQIADSAVEVIAASGLMKDGLSFQTGAGGISLAVSEKLGHRLVAEGLTGGFISGGITEHQVKLVRAGVFQSLIDVQCFDQASVASFRDDAWHRAMSAAEYASPTHPAPIVDQLDVMILGAAEIDQHFNINVVTGGNGVILGGSGGHADTAAGSKLAIATTRLTGGGFAKVVDHVRTISTPGSTVDVLVTEAGIAVNPLRPELKTSLLAANLPITNIATLIDAASAQASRSPLPKPETRTIALIEGRQGDIIDQVSRLEQAQ